MSDQSEYQQRLVNWAWYAGAILVVGLLSGLVGKWLGTPVAIPTPPVPVSQPAPVVIVFAHPGQPMQSVPVNLKEKP